MRSRHLVVIVAVVAFSLGTAQTALADNNATGSVGAVQTGPVGATPTAGAKLDRRRPGRWREPFEQLHRHRAGELRARLTIGVGRSLGQQRDRKRSRDCRR